MVKNKVDLVLPVYNEEAQLKKNALKVYSFLKGQPGYDWRILIVSNGSTDRTAVIGERLSRQYPEISLLNLKEKGRGRALKTAWLASKAEILSYMDIDLSADLKFYPKMIQAVQENFDLAVGSRLGAGAEVNRGFRREVISRSYNLLIKILFQTHFSDAQCGFKAISRVAAQKILPLVKDNYWFFDSELLIIAEKMGLRIFNLPIAWVDDPGSTVKILRTARGDLEGLARLWWTKPWKKVSSI